MSQKLILLGSNERIDKECKEVLSTIRKTYGNTTQILVSNEELCELAAVCAKFPRYEDPEKARSELHSAAVDEVADVMIILDHVINIFQLDDLEIRSRIQGKIDRIRRWLSASSSQEQTTVDREVKEGENPQPEEKAPEKPTEKPETESKVCPCRGCTHVGDFQALKIGGRCFLCSTQGWNLFESKYATGVGQGYRVQPQATRTPGGKLTWTDLMMLQVRARRQGRAWPEEVSVLIKRPNEFKKFDEESYGVSWEALWR